MHYNYCKFGNVFYFVISVFQLLEKIKFSCKLLTLQWFDCWLSLHLKIQKSKFNTIKPLLNLFVAESRQPDGIYNGQGAC